VTSDEHEPSDASEAATARPQLGRSAIVLLTVIALVAIGAAAFSIGRLSMLGDPRPSSTSAEAGFARDMQVHHQQGVELAMIVRDATDNEEIRLLAYDIATTQSQQSGQMYGWLAEWGLPQFGPEPAMTWMTRSGDGSTARGAHDGMDMGDTPGLMPGMATPLQVEKLRSLEGVEAERMFLELMIAHHRGAVEMAQSVLERSVRPVVVALAESIIASQKAELDVMMDALAERS
jgi:uncharacterized protein (DUF305 family)